MSRSPLPENARLHELLAERALGGLTEAEAQELSTLLATAGVGADETYELAAAMAAEAMVRAEGVAPLPEELRKKLEARAARANGAGDVVARVDFRSEARSRSEGVRWLPWLVAAASLALALHTWKSAPRGGGTIVPERERERVLAMGGTSMSAWGDFTLEKSVPEIPGVHGDVVWNESAQSGYMRFENLPKNDPNKEQYQLWIIDKRGLSQRVSGGVFNVSDAKGQAVVKIEPSIKIQGAAAFAVTIEPPGGNAVSDMTRRVCIAAVK